MSIQPLPNDVIAQIKSSSTITSLNGAVCGLFKNSLDSRATKVTISIDYVRGSCSVEDDGLGILPAEFKAGGGLGKLHFTSKHPVDEGVHGKYGTFLASLASLSLLSITSHHHKHHTHNSIQIHNSDVLARHTPSPPDQRLLSFPHGTRVTVRDLFGLMPVRVKQRAIDAERGIHSKQWESLKRDIVAFMLAWDGLISVLVREPTSRWTFSARSSQTHQERQASKLDLPAKVSKILYQAQLSDENKPEAWVPLKVSAGKLSVTGAVSLHPIATKRIQFISIGIRPVRNEHGSNVLYEEINRIFSNSSYGLEELDNPKADAHVGREKDGQCPRDSFTGQELRGRKGVDRWPMFYIKIQIGESANSILLKEVDELFDERHGNLAAIVDILKAVVYEFLKKYHFRPKRARATREDTPNKASRPDSHKISLTGKYDSKITSSETGTRIGQLVGDLATTRLSIHYDRASRSRSESPFDLWSRIKSGSPQHVLNNKKVDKKSIGDGHQTPSVSRTTSPDINTRNSASTPPLFGPDGRLLRAPFAAADDIGENVDQELQSARAEKGPLIEDIRWTNPVTKETSIIDPKTGFVILHPKDPADGRREKSDSIRCKRLRLHGRSTPDTGQSVWLREVLSSWENPVFEATEPRIPSAFSEENSLCRSMQPIGCSTWFQGSPEVGAPIQGRVSKAALRRAEIIAQVDRKFIFAKVLVDSFFHGPATVPHSTASLLILIDQHAADERCRVESLMKDYFVNMGDDGDMSDMARSQAAPMRVASVACTELLERSLKFDISSRDAAQLKRTVPHFSQWGIHYHISQIGNAGQRQVEVTKLPPSIAERCRLEPRLLIELLRKETWKVDEHNGRETSAAEPSTQDGEATITHWIAKFHGCPEGILDMINSRACRSSIMFNDPLSREECANLLRRLADCAFPFQCAHGRPSMVPLVDLGDDLTYTSNEKKPAADSFRNAFKAWATERDTRDHGK
ncbi:hypothetical protein F4859DRAFT_492686 [Xylaria cf. heliscus]|nr:hypothetical protein F4859DRAFT_492686 [Xylaria cf. heliscus]